MSDAASAAAPCPVVRARSILQKVRYDGNEWFGIDYNMNLYRGCCHGCIYCDSRSECYRIDDFDQVSVKFDALAILRRELRSRRVRGIVGVGAMSDTYNPFERTLRVTRGALELIEEFGFGVSVDTKSTLITRDIDVLSAIGAAGGAIAKITVTTADDQLARIIEPHAPSPSERFAALAELADAGVFCGVLFTPTLPFVTDDDATVRGVVEGATASATTSSTASQPWIPRCPSAIARHSATDTSATAPAQPRTAPSSARCASSTACFGACPTSSPPTSPPNLWERRRACSKHVNRRSQPRTRQSRA